MKQLKDYLPLYIGQFVYIFPDETLTDGWLQKKLIEYPELRWKLEVTPETLVQRITDNYKLILRPLSEMNEEERIEFYEKYFGRRMANDYTGDTGSAYFQPKKVIPTTDHIMRIVCGDDYSSGDFMKVVEMVPWLLSKGFDLFGLQATGIAVYQSDLKK